MGRCDYLDPALAWSGVKDSGRGVSLSKFGAHQAKWGYYFFHDLGPRLRSTHAGEVGAHEGQYIVNSQCEYGGTETCMVYACVVLLVVRVSEMYQGI